ncbi:hypothetical protein TNCV_1118721 [Trichonephila clavipes]|uniref:Uncharacterized protein n=1 Tax=Trichonephila clavipes TaxID=2585209 RepID=A0A8X6SZS2_TRICX|nr:hypothetical protein TNCV_1118721 [Trichonephila clavipes]
MVFNHCMIHRQALVAKYMDEELHNILHKTLLVQVTTLNATVLTAFQYFAMKWAQHKLAGKVQSNQIYLEDCGINFPHVRSRSGNLDNNRADQRGILPGYGPFDVCAVIPMNAFCLGKNSFDLNHRIPGLT